MDPPTKPHNILGHMSGTSPLTSFIFNLISELEQFCVLPPLRIQWSLDSLSQDPPGNETSGAAKERPTPSKEVSKQQIYTMLVTQCNRMHIVITTCTCMYAVICNLMMMYM